MFGETPIFNVMIWRSSNWFSTIFESGMFRIPGTHHVTKIELKQTIPRLRPNWAKQRQKPKPLPFQRKQRRCGAEGSEGRNNLKGRKFGLMMQKPCPQKWFFSWYSIELVLTKKFHNFDFDRFEKMRKKRLQTSQTVFFLHPNTSMQCSDSLSSGAI